MNKESKIYVAGHRGLVGSALVRALADAGYHHILTRCHSELDLEQKQAVETFFDTQRPDYVFLAAAKVGGIWANNTYPVDFLLNNLKIQNNVIEAAFCYGVKGLLFLGSSCIYPKLASQPLKEEYLLTGSLEPTNEPYAISKIAGIKLCEAYNRQYGTRFFSVMPTNLYGPNDHYDLQTSHVLPALIRKFHLAKLAAQGKVREINQDEQHYGPIPEDVKAALGLHTKTGTHKNNVAPKVILWGTGSPRREFLYVDDMAQACVFLMEHLDQIFPASSKDKGHTPLTLINIGWGKDISIRELADMVAKIVGFTGEIEWDSTKPDGTPRKLLDVSRLTGLGFQPKISLKEGIERAYQDYLKYKP